MDTEICYPFAVTKDGDLMTTASRVEQCRQAILSVLKTQTGERVYRPEYGMPDSLFTTSKVAGTLALVRSALDVGLEEYPDCTYQLQGYVDDAGRVITIVNYHIEETSGTLTTPL